MDVRPVVLCAVCGKAANPESPSTARKVIGWITPRQSGGANHIRYQQPQADHAHLACLAELKTPAQAFQDEFELGGL